MIEELKKYIDELFKDAPKTRAAYELKEELLANSSDRYFDLVEDGIAENEALDIVIHSIGDIDQLFSAEAVKSKDTARDEETRKKVALYKSIAIGMYIMGFAFAVAIDEFTRFPSLGPIVMLVMIALATCILVYVGMAYPKYKKADDTVVEEFKEWNSSQKKKKAIKSSVNTIIWMIITVLYFIISFATFAWHVTWIIFLVGVCAQAIANLVFNLYEK